MTAFAKAQQAFMGNPSPEANEFAKRIKAARDSISKTPDIFRRPSAANSGDQHGALSFLRRWNSHTPFVVGGYGGGYFLRWANRGVAIDPGPAFVQAYSRFTEYSLTDIDMIIVTHDHSDHCVELGVMLSLLREYNKQRRDNGLDHHSWDVILSAGAYAQHESVLRHADMDEFVNVRKAMAADEIGRACLCKEYSFSFTCTPTNHKELAGLRTGFGLTVQLLGPAGRERRISFSSDTAVESGTHGMAVSSLKKAWKSSAMLVLHAGTFESPFEGRQRSFSRLTQHMGFRGIRDVLLALNDSPELKVVVISEWGDEFGKIGVHGRSRFCELLEEDLNGMECSKYYSATRILPPAGHESLIPIVPADIPLRVSLPGFDIWCEDRASYRPHGEAIAVERGEEIVYATR